MFVVVTCESFSPKVEKCENVRRTYESSSACVSPLMFNAAARSIHLPTSVAAILHIQNHCCNSGTSIPILLQPFDVAIVLYASTRVRFHFVLRHSRHLSVVPVTPPSFPSSLHHHRLFILRTVHYRLSSSLRLSSFVLFFVTDLFRPCHVPSIISRFCGCTILL